MAQEKYLLDEILRKKSALDDLEKTLSSELESGKNNKDNQKNYEYQQTIKKLYTKQYVLKEKMQGLKSKLDDIKLDAFEPSMKKNQTVIKKI